METPNICYIAVGRDPQEACRKIRKAIAELKELDKQADQLEDAIIKFLNEDAHACFSNSMHKPIKWLRCLISCYIKDYRQFLAEYK